MMFFVGFLFGSIITTIIILLLINKQKNNNKKVHILQPTKHHDETFTNWLIETGLINKRNLK